MRYDLERLGQLNIKDVLEALGARPSTMARYFTALMSMPTRTTTTMLR